MTKIFDVTTYEPQASDILFFDANIWFLLFAPIGSYRKKDVDKYSDFLAKVFKNKSTIVVSSQILSELFNTHTRSEFKKSKYKNFKKDFKPTRKYKDSINFMKSVIQSKILKYAKAINDDFNTINLTKLFKDLEKHDFNDKYYAELAKKNNFKIVTHDKDFKQFGNEITIITVV